VTSGVIHRNYTGRGSLNRDATDGLAPRTSDSGELAEAAGVSVRTVRRCLRLDLVKHVHFLGVIRIPREEYERILRDGIPRGGPVAHGTS